MSVTSADLVLKCKLNAFIDIVAGYDAMMKSTSIKLTRRVYWQMLLTPTMRLVIVAISKFHQHALVFLYLLFVFLRLWCAWLLLILLIFIYNFFFENKLQEFEKNIYYAGLVRMQRKIEKFQNLNPTSKFRETIFDCVRTRPCSRSYWNCDTTQRRSFVPTYENECSTTL